MQLCIKSDPRFLKSEQREDKYQKKMCDWKCELGKSVFQIEFNEEN